MKTTKQISASALQLLEQKKENIINRFIEIIKLKKRPHESTEPLIHFVGNVFKELNQLECYSLLKSEPCTLYTTLFHNFYNNKNASIKKLANLSYDTLVLYFSNIEYLDEDIEIYLS